MGKTTGIQWADHTFNTHIGCTKVSPACEHCYAEADQADRRGRVIWGPKGTRSVTSPSYWKQPIAWDKAAREAGERRRVFCCSLADVFEDWNGSVLDHKKQQLFVRRDGELAPVTLDDIRVRLFTLIQSTPNLDWLLLTKRPENALRMMVRAGLYTVENPNLPCPQPNLWIGTSAENQQWANKRIPWLLRTPAAVRFLSCEPLLGPIQFTSAGLIPATGDHPDLEGYMVGPDDGRSSLWPTREEALTKSGIHWVIVGGESGKGPDIRPMHPVG
jgi:protein gp37